LGREKCEYISIKELLIKKIDLSRERERERERERMKILVAQDS